MDYDKLKDFAEDTIRQSTRPSRFPFRNRFEHTLRVLQWAERIPFIVSDFC